MTITIYRHRNGTHGFYVSPYRWNSAPDGFEVQPGRWVWAGSRSWHDDHGAYAWLSASYPDVESVASGEWCEFQFDGPLPSFLERAQVSS